MDNTTVVLLLLCILTMLTTANFRWVARKVEKYDIKYRHKRFEDILNGDSSKGTFTVTEIAIGEYRTKVMVVVRIKKSICPISIDLHDDGLIDATFYERNKFRPNNVDMVAINLESGKGLLESIEEHVFEMKISGESNKRLTRIDKLLVDGQGLALRWFIVSQSIMAMTVLGTIIYVELIN